MENWSVNRSSNVSFQIDYSEYQYKILIRCCQATKYAPKLVFDYFGLLRNQGKVIDAMMNCLLILEYDGEEVNVLFQL